MHVSHPNADSDGVLPDEPRTGSADLISELYAELRALAARHLRGQRVGATVTPTVLVHEAYLKLDGDRQAKHGDRAQFLALASVAMRRVLVDHARARRRLKRGGGAHATSLTDSIAIDPGSPPIGVMALEDALVKLAQVDADAVRVVEMKYFGGATELEVAQYLGKTRHEVQGLWKYARAFLQRELSKGST